MAENNIDREVEEILDSLRDVDGSLKNIGETSNESTDYIKEIGNVSKGSAITLGKFTNQIISNTSDMKTVGNVISTITKSIGDIVPVGGALISSIGNLSAQAIDMFQDSFNSYQKLSNVGLTSADGMIGLRDAAYEASIPLEKYSGMLEKNSQDLAFVFGTAVKGSHQFGKVVKSLLGPTNDEMRNLGYTVEELGDVAVNYSKIQQSLGLKQTMTTDELVQSSLKYSEELDLLAKVTGLSRKEQMAERERMLSDSRFRAVLVKMEREHGKKAADALMAFSSQIGASSKEAQQAFQDYSSGVINTESARNATIAGMTPAFQKFIASVNQGDTSMVNVNDHFNEVSKAAKKAAIWEETIALYGGKAIPGMMKFNELTDLANKRLITREEYFKKILPSEKAQRNAQDKSVEVANQFNAIILKANTAFNELFLRLFPASSAIDLFSSGIDQATEWVNNFVSSSNPGTIKEMLNDTMLNVKDFGKTMLEVGKGIKKALEFFGLIDSEEEQKQQEYNEQGKSIGNAYKDKVDAVDDVADAKEDLAEMKEKLRSALAIDQNIDVTPYESKIVELQEILAKKEKILHSKEDSLAWYETDRGKQKLIKENLEKLIQEKKDIQGKIKHTELNLDYDSVGNKILGTIAGVFSDTYMTDRKVWLTEEMNAEKEKMALIDASIAKTKESLKEQIKIAATPVRRTTTPSNSPLSNKIVNSSKTVIQNIQEQAKPNFVQVQRKIPLNQNKVSMAGPLSNIAERKNELSTLERGFGDITKKIANIYSAPSKANNEELLKNLNAQLMHAAESIKEYKEMNKKLNQVFQVMQQTQKTSSDQLKEIEGLRNVQKQIAQNAQG